MKERIAALLRVIRDAAPGDADLATLWDLIQADFYANQRVIIEILHKKRALKPALDVTARPTSSGRSTIPTCGCSWSTRRLDPGEFEKWFADTACAQLLKPAPRAKR